MMSSFNHPALEILSELMNTVLNSDKKEKALTADPAGLCPYKTSATTDDLNGCAREGMAGSVAVTSAPPPSTAGKTESNPTATNEHVEKETQPTIIDVDLEASLSPPPNPPILKFNPKPMTTITILDDEEEETNQAMTTKTPPNRPVKSAPKQPITENLSVDDDDEIQIVSTAIVQPPRTSIAIDVDEDEVSTVQDNVNRNRVDIPSSSGPASIHPSTCTNHSNPQMQQSHTQQDSTAQSSLEIIECTPVASNHNSQPRSNRIERKSTSCVLCDVRVRDRQPFSRCKHILCDNCLLRAVAQPENSQQKIAQPESKPEHSKTSPAQSSGAAVSSKPSFSSSLLRNMPVCPVVRCGAPLTHAEVYQALVPAGADEAFVPALRNFNEWMQNTPNSVYGPGHVQFPPFEPGPSQSSMTADSNGDSEPEQFLLEDDLLLAYSPLWVWDDEYTCPSSSTKGGWMCLACGEYEPVKPSTTIAPSTSKVSPDSVEPASQEDSISPQGSVTPDEADSTVPDPPLHTHCAYARGLGIVETMKGLAEAREGNYGKKPKRRSQRKTSTTSTMRTRKRYRSATTISNAKRRKTSQTESSAAGGFAKGTGYAGRSGSEWKGTSSKLLAEKAKIDQAVTHWLLRVRCFLIMSKDAPLSSWPGFMRGLLRQRSIVSHLSAILINESIMDIQERFPVYLAALRVVHAICDIPCLRLLATEPPDADEKTDANSQDGTTKFDDNTSGELKNNAGDAESKVHDNDIKMNGENSSNGASSKTIAELVESISKQAALLSSGAGPEALPKSTEVLIKQIRRCIRLINRHKLLAIVRKRNGIPEKPVDLDAEDEPGQNMDKGKEETDIDGGNGSVNEGKMDSEDKPNTTEQADEFESDKRLYLKEMKNFQFETVPGLAKTNCFYEEAMKMQATSVPTGKRQRRIAGEVASLFSSLPLSWSSTILLRADEDRYDFLRAVIFGPEETPYDSGAFVFDIWLPMEYPTVPPKFRLLTTGAGRVRFNPNLYNNGKVCLSLLGTWSGPSWTSASTILQVLVSIQSLILVPDPYFNEPGYERQMGTVTGQQQSARYNERVRKDCAFYAIQYNIRGVTSDVQKGILTHFRLKRRYIKKILRDWFPIAMKELDEMDRKGINPLASDPNNTSDGSTDASKNKKPVSFQDQLKGNVLPPPHVKSGANVIPDPDGSAGPSAMNIKALSTTHPVHAQIPFGIGHAFNPASIIPGVINPHMIAPQHGSVSQTTSKTVSSLNHPNGVAAQGTKSTTQLPSMAMLTQSLSPHASSSASTVPANPNATSTPATATNITPNAAEFLMSVNPNLSPADVAQIWPPASSSAGPTSATPSPAMLFNVAQQQLLSFVIKPGRNFRSYSIPAANLKTILNDLDKL